MKKISKISCILSAIFLSILLISCSNDSPDIDINNEVININTYGDYCNFGIVGEIDGLKGTYVTNLNEINLNTYIGNENGVSYAVISSSTLKLYIGYSEYDSIEKINLDINGKISIDEIEYINQKSIDLSFAENEGLICLDINIIEIANIKVNSIKTKKKDIMMLGESSLVIIPVTNLIKLNNNSFTINSNDNIEIKEVIGAEKNGDKYIYDGAATVSYIYKYGDKNINCYHQIKN